MENDKPFFSVIVPTYNRAEFIASSLASLLKQQYTEFEIIVVDDASTDHTHDVIDSLHDARVRYIKKEVNQERAAARNTGVKAARGEYITFLDSDDCAYPNHLSTAHEVLRSQGSPEVLHSAYEIKNDQGKILYKINNVKNVRREIVMGNPLSCIGVFVRNDVMQENLFNEDRDLSGLEDWELWLRMSAKYNFSLSHTITSTMIQHSQRSVVQFDLEKMILKMERFIFYICENSQNKNFYGEALKKASASVKTYTALHLALAGAKRKLVKHYWVMGITENPLEIFRKRSFVILKFILLK